MKDEDIIGKEFLAVYFEKDNMLHCDGSYVRLLGMKGIVTNIHKSHKRYARVKFDVDSNVGPDALHWPVEVIKKQLEENLYKETPEYTENLFKEIFKLTKI